jgi:FkbM family methyltransferase
MSRLVNEKILSKVQGVIHVGASIGQEREYYAKHNLSVIWFEPNPDAFKMLQHNIAELPKQIAYPFLLTDRDDETFLLHITNGFGQASSIFDMGEQLKLYPDFVYVRDVEALSITLDTCVHEAQIDLNIFQFLVLDTQGADLLVLKGAIHVLRQIQFVEVETSSLEMYRGGCLEQEVIDFMISQGFDEQDRMALNLGIDNHILFERNAT